MDLKRQIDTLRQEAAAEALEQDQIKADLEANSNEDSVTKQEIEAIKKQIEGL
ncbi:hypothetical protein [Helicobacter bilis]|uniref:hypothetical protein n=1 Tax=Helicobacter bilis TaxID=37372 RepID=UPI0003A702E7|nr:hypothetical protein [Helicobacter bilis]